MADVAVDESRSEASAAMPLASIPCSGSMVEQRTFNPSTATGGPAKKHVTPGRCSANPSLQDRAVPTCQTVQNFNINTARFVIVASS
jgi:hypothetical protein